MTTNGQAKRWVEMILWRAAVTSKGEMLLWVARKLKVRVQDKDRARDHGRQEYWTPKHPEATGNLRHPQWWPNRPSN